MSEFPNVLRVKLYAELSAKIGWGREKLKLAFERAISNTVAQNTTNRVIPIPGANMSLKIRFRFDGRCSLHPRYNPEKDGRPQHKDCPGCDSLWVVHLYSGIARRKAETGEGILVSHPESYIGNIEPTTASEEDPTSATEERQAEKLARDTTEITELR